MKLLLTSDSGGSGLLGVSGGGESHEAGGQLEGLKALQGGEIHPSEEAVQQQWVDASYKTHSHVITSLAKRQANTHWCRRRSECASRSE